MFGQQLASLAQQGLALARGGREAQLRQPPGRLRPRDFERDVELVGQR